MMNFISGVHNYHKIGIDEYILRHRVSETEGMIRLVHNTGDALRSLLGPNGDFLFAPHNHRQDVTLYCVAGNPLNVEVDDRVSGHGGYQWVFESEITDGKMATHFRNCGDLDVVQVEPIPEDGLYLESQRIHTLVTEPGAAWLIVEGALATIAHPRHVNYCYSNLAEFKLQTTPELYKPMDHEAVEKGWLMFAPEVWAILDGAQRKASV